MIWDMNDREFESVIALPIEKRYSYSIKRFVDWDTIWSLGANDGWVMAADDANHEYIPVWPHPRLAESCAVGQWAGNSPRPISLKEWMEDWLPGIENDNRLIAVFPTHSNNGVSVTPSGMRDGLLEEMENYELDE